jgi:hypothetical protein
VIYEYQTMKTRLYGRPCRYVKTLERELLVHFDRQKSSSFINHFFGSGLLTSMALFLCILNVRATIILNSSYILRRCRSNPSSMAAGTGSRRSTKICSSSSMLSLRSLTTMRNSSSFLSNTCDERRALPRWSAKETYLL